MTLTLIFLSVWRQVYSFVAKVYLVLRVRRLSLGISVLDDVFQAVAARQLLNVGFDVRPGQKVQYLIVGSDNKRVRAAQLLGSKTKFDVEKYLGLLISATDTLFNIFGYDCERIRSQVLHREKQTVLN